MKRIHLVVVLLVLTSVSTWNQPIMSQSGKTPAPSEEKAVPRNLAILIFDGVQIIDYTGPYETFGHAYSNDGPAFNIYTVSEKAAPITTAMGMTVTPKYRLEDAPRPDVLVIPGGSVDDQMVNPHVIKWIQETSRTAEVVMSVCNGAFILAKAGLLDGLEATTTSGLIPGLRAIAPKTKVVDDKRYVDNGKIITTAGLSSGIDGSLHVIERLFGRGTAQMAALGMEYNWDPESKFVRASLADRYMRFNYDVKVAAGGWRPLSREGSSNHWENTWTVRTETSAAELLDTINSTIANNKTYGGPPLVKWTRLPGDSQKIPNKTSWQFTDEKGMVWNGVVQIQPEAGQEKQYTLSVKIARSDSSVQHPGN